MKCIEFVAYYAGVGEIMILAFKLKGIVFSETFVAETASYGVAYKLYTVFGQSRFEEFASFIEDKASKIALAIQSVYHIHCSDGVFSRRKCRGKIDNGILGSVEAHFECLFAVNAYHEIARHGLANHFQ